jgi:hypothetical protein
MKIGIALAVIVLLVIVVLGFPTRARMRRALTPPEGPHPLARPFLALDRWRKQRRERRRRRHLRRL